MSGTGDAVGKHTGKLQSGSIMCQSIGDRPQRLRHAGHIDHGHHRQLQQSRQIGTTGLAIEQAHHPLDQNHIGLARSLVY